MSHVARSSFLLAALFVALLGIASAARGDSHSEDASKTAASETAASEKGTSPAPDSVVGGRDISARRSPKLVWIELVEIRDKMYEVSDERELRSVLLTPQEQALFVAFAKRMYDLSKELNALTHDEMDHVHQIKVRRSMQQFRASLGDLSAVASGFVHRDLSDKLLRMTLQMKGLYQMFPEPGKLLGPEGLPPLEDLKPKYPS